MELNWSTFILEILNFLVLVWILKRFFYRPVLNVLARRRAGIEKILSDAKTLHHDAEALQAQYRGRLADWELERQQAREQLVREIEEERAQRLAALQSELEQEREKARVAEARRQSDAMHKAEETALIQAARFASRVLGQVACPELEEKLLGLVIDELPQLPAEQIAALRNNRGQIPETIVVASAFPLSDSQRQKLRKALIATTGTDLPLHFEQDVEILAGVRITIGPWVLGANLRDELRSFAEFAHDTRYS
ncbi:MAG TPA: ATPase [Gammaproteobacteria bacterium]|nr:ATPase [Gammaproteobacteria bacterium]